MAYQEPVVCMEIAMPANIIMCVNMHAPGSYPCLCCHIPNDQMNTALHARGYASKRSLETIQKGLEGFMANGGKKRAAKQHYNCISDPIFNIPITQVCVWHSMAKINSLCTIGVLTRTSYYTASIQNYIL